MQKILLLLACAFCSAALRAQSAKSLEAVRLDCHPAIDGQINDSCWQNAAVLDGFTASMPVFGNQPLGRTEVLLFYTETALYVAARCRIPESSKVRDDGGVRDGALTGDWLQLSLDTWNDDRMAFDFTVSAAGVPYDTRNSSGWNAGWQSAVSIQADGWTLEIGIPFTALRFPRKPEQHWGLQLTRYDRATGETSTWSPQDPLVQDRVLQFGTLNGLHDIRQLRRLGFSAYTNTEMRSRTSPVEVNSVDQTLSIDGRVGLNESATLDFTLLPPLLGAFRFGRYSSPNNQFKILHNVEVSVPRQLFQEERDLFDKNPRIRLNPVVHGGPFLSDHPLEPGERYTDLSSSKLLHATRLSARTRGNWRFGVYNAFLSPVKATIRNDSLEKSYERTLQGLSNYNAVSAEYILPNNGFIQLSNASIMAGTNRASAAPKLDFHLRNRRNTLALGGAGQMTYELSDTIRENRYHYSLSLARVNRRWGWDVSWYESLIPGSAGRPGNLFGSANAGATYRDYRPRGPFLNVTGYLRAHLSYNGKISLPDDQLLISGQIAATDRRFRGFAIGFSAIPYTQKIRYHNSSTTFLYRKHAPQISPTLAIITDQRKRMIGRISLGATVSTEGEVSYAGLTFTPEWVLSCRLRLLAGLQMWVQPGALQALEVPGRWIFEQRDEWAMQADLQIQWYPCERLLVFGRISAQSSDITNRKTVEMLAVGEFAPVNWPLPPNIGQIPGEAQIGFQYFFTPLSQIRFRHIFGEDDSLYFKKPNPTVPYRLSGTTELTVIYFLDGAMKR